MNKHTSLLIQKKTELKERKKTLRVRMEKKKDWKPKNKSNGPISHRQSSGLLREPLSFRIVP
jgi:hypothetical protein